MPIVARYRHSDFNYCECCLARIQFLAKTSDVRHEFEKARQCRKDTISDYLAMANIPRKFEGSTFENYKVTTDQQKAVVQNLKRFLANPDNVGLIMIGNPGTGKNHLAVATMKAIIQEKAQSAVIVKIAKMIRELKDNWITKNHTEQSIMDKYVEPYLLVVNEIGLQFGSETEQNYFTEIIDDRLGAVKPTILIGNVNITQMEQLIGERIIDRFKDGGKSLVFNWPSYRLRNRAD